MRRHLVIALVAVRILVAAGCGGDDATIGPTGPGGQPDAATAQSDASQATDGTVTVDVIGTDATKLDVTGEDTTTSDVDSTDAADDTATSDAGASDASDDTDASDDAGVDASDDVVDASNPLDAADSAVADAADAASNKASGTIYFGGDYAVDFTNTVGYFKPSTSSGGEIDATPGNLTRADMWYWDVSANKVAYAANAENGSRYDLYVADRNGANQTKIVEPPGTQDVWKVKFSPDGTLIAFIADLTTAGQRDVWVVPVGGGTPKQVSPARPSPSAALQPFDIVWSPDSKYVAIAGDLETDQIEQLWITDATQASPAPVTALTSAQVGATAGKGVQLELMEFGLQNRVFFLGSLLTATNRTLYQVDVDGQNLKRVPNTPSSKNVGSFGVSKDKSSVAFATDTLLSGAYEIYVMPSDGSVAATRVTSGDIPANKRPLFTELLRWSPDASLIAFCADYSSTFGGHNDVFVVPSAGGGQRRVAHIAGDPDQDAFGVVWSPDNTEVAFIADQSAQFVNQAYRVSVAVGASQTPILVHSVVANGDMNRITWAP